MALPGRTMNNTPTNPLATASHPGRLTFSPSHQTRAVTGAHRRNPGQWSGNQEIRIEMGDKVANSSRSRPQQAFFRFQGSNARDAPLPAAIIMISREKHAAARKSGPSLASRRLSMRMEAHIHGTVLLRAGTTTTQIEEALRPWLEYIDEDNMADAKSVHPDEPGLVFDRRRRV